MAYTYTYTLAQFVALTQPQPSIAQLRRDIEDNILGQTVLAVMPQQYADVAAETPTAPTSYRVEFTGQLSAPNASLLDSIIAEHTGVYTPPKSKISINGGTLEYGSIPDGSLLERNGNILQRAVNVARVKRYITSQISSLAATSNGTAETFLTFPVIAGKDYAFDVFLTATLATTNGLNFVCKQTAGADISSVHLMAHSPQSSTSIKHQSAYGTGVAPFGSTSSTTTAGTYMYRISGVFECAASGNVTIGAYKGGTGTLTVLSGKANVQEITWS